MIYICIPAHNEEQTVGVVLWKIRQVMAEYPRDYQLLVVDDASTDSTPDVLAPYARVLPLTVVRTESKQGEGAALEMMLREAVRRSEYPKRDMIVTLQADFTQEPDELVSLIKRMEAGADIVVGESEPQPATPRWTRWARAIALRVLGKQRIPAGVRDPFTSYRAYRVAAVKGALAGREGRLVHWDGWAGAAELLLATAPHARRVDTVELVERRERLQRPSRLRPWRALRSVWAVARESRPLQVTSPAELDNAMRAIAAVRTSEVTAHTGSRSGTQRHERGRGTSEERRAREQEGHRREPAARGSGRTQRTERPERPERPERGEPRGERSGGRQRPAAGERQPGGDSRLPARAQRRPAGAQDQPAPEPAAADPAAVAPAAGERPKRKRPRRRKRSAGGAAAAAGLPGEIAESGAETAVAAAPDAASAELDAVVPTAAMPAATPAEPGSVPGPGDRAPALESGAATLAEVDTITVAALASQGAPPPGGRAEEQPHRGAGPAFRLPAASLPGANGGDLGERDDADAPESAAEPTATDPAGGARPAARRRRRGRRGGRRRNPGSALPLDAEGGEGGGAGAEQDTGERSGAEQMGIFELIEGERTNES